MRASCYLSTVKSDPCESRADYLGYVAHEMRNPLATALWCAELLGRLPPEERAGERGQRLALSVQRAIQRLSRLVEDHFLAERVSSRGVPLHLEQVPVREVLAEAAERGAPGLAEVEAPGDLAARADRALLSRALEALVAAAARDGTRVRAEARPGAGGAVVTVRGAPAKPSDLELPHKGSPSDASGRSLGLTVAAAVAAAHGAGLEVQDGALVLTWPVG